MMFCEMGLYRPQCSLCLATGNVDTNLAVLLLAEVFSSFTSPVSLQTDSKRYLSWAFNLNVYLSKQINTHTHIAYNVHLKMQHAPNIFTFVMVYKSSVNKGWAFQKRCFLAVFLCQNKSSIMLKSKEKTTIKSICLSVYLSICLSVYLYICLSVYMKSSLAKTDNAVFNNFQKWCNIYIYIYLYTHH